MQFPLNPSDFGRLNKSFSKGVMNSLVAEISHKVSCNEFGIWDIWGKLHGAKVLFIVSIVMQQISGTLPQIRDTSSIA